MDNKSVSDAIQKVKDETDAILYRKVSTTEVFLDADRNNVRNQETNMGDLVTDAMRDVTGVQVALLCVVPCVHHGRMGISL